MKIQGITIKLSGDTKELQSALSGVNSNLSSTQSELRKIQNQLKFDPTNTVLLAQKQELLSKATKESEEKVKLLRNMLEKHNAEMKGAAVVTDEMKAQHRALEREIAKTESQMKSYSDNGVKKLSQAYQSLKNKVQDIREEHKTLATVVDKARDALKKVGSVSLKGLQGAAKATSASFKAAGAAIATVGTAAIAVASKVGKKVVEMYGELEQNLGGSEAVFGQYAETIQKTGEDAYKALGVSQSEYLATANKMGALFQGAGIDQQKSLDLTTKAMQRAADMASVMGIDSASAMEAVTGAAKGNFTMMDNLGVAMNATSIQAYALSKGLDFTWKSASNAEKAEVAMQMFFEKTSQYAGNFEREATQTVTGSIGLLKASISSFTAGLGNSEADMKNLTNNVVDAFGIVTENITPIIENAAAVLPEVMDALIKSISDLLPTLATTASDLALTLVDGVIDNLPAMTDAAIQLISTLGDGIIDNGEKIITAITDTVTTLSETFLKPENIEKVIGAAFYIIETLTKTLITKKNITLLTKTAVEVVVSLSKGLADNVELLIDSIMLMITTIVDVLLEDDNITKLISAAADIVIAIGGGLIGAIPDLLEAAFKLVVALADALLNYDWSSIGKKIIAKVKEKWFGDDEEPEREPNGGRTPDGSHANGLAYVPYNGYLAELHEGERVLTRTEARTYSEGGAMSAAEARAIRDEIRALRADMASGKMTMNANINNTREFGRAVNSVVR